MEAKWIENENGRVSIATYTREDMHMRPCVQDIYDNLPEFNDSIQWIMYIHPNACCTVQDVLDCLINDYSNIDTLLFAQAGTICPIPASGSIAEGKEFISNQKNLLTNSMFDRISFNRCMEHSYGNDCIYLFHNDTAENWIKNNTGENKIIDYSSGEFAEYNK